LDWLNYHHLLYFWTVAKEGGVSKAAAKLHLAQPTLSSQIKKLESQLGTPLLEKSGRSVQLTEVGQTVFGYAEEIFGLGKELVDVVHNRMPEDRSVLTVGVPDVLPKLVVYQLLQPALAQDPKLQLVCYEGKLRDLLSELAMHQLDVVIADNPLTPDTNIRAFNHLLGECGISIFGDQHLHKKYVKNFPQSLNAAPMLLPTQNTVLRRQMEQWFDAMDIYPDVRHEFEDSAILKVFGQEGHGLFAGPTAIEKQICQQYSVKPLGHVEEIKERFYAISIERRIKHPAVLSISDAAQKKLFGV